MAKKGQKFRKFTNEEREEIVSKYLSGKYSYEQVAKEYQISWKTVESMVRKYKNTGTTRALPKGVNGKIKCRNSVNYFVGFPTFLYAKIYI